MYLYMNNSVKSIYLHIFGQINAALVSIRDNADFLTVLYIFLLPQEVLHLLQKSPSEIRLSICRPLQDEHTDIETPLVTSFLYMVGNNSKINMLFLKLTSFFDRVMSHFQAVH